MSTNRITAFYGKNSLDLPSTESLTELSGADFQVPLLAVRTELSLLLWDDYSPAEVDLLWGKMLSAYQLSQKETQGWTPDFADNAAIHLREVLTEFSHEELCRYAEEVNKK